MPQRETKGVYGAGHYRARDVCSLSYAARMNTDSALQDHTRNCSRGLSKSRLLLRHQGPSGRMPSTKLRRTCSQRFTSNQQQHNPSCRFCTQLSPRYHRRYPSTLSPRPPKERVSPTTCRLLSRLLHHTFPCPRRLSHRPVRFQRQRCH